MKLSQQIKNKNIFNKFNIKKLIKIKSNIENLLKEEKNEKRR